MGNRERNNLPLKKEKSTQKINRDVLTFTEVFVNQKRVNIHEHPVKVYLFAQFSNMLCRHFLTHLFLVSKFK